MLLPLWWMIVTAVSGPEASSTESDALAARTAPVEFRPGDARSAVRAVLSQHDCRDRLRDPGQLTTSPWRRSPSRGSASGPRPHLFVYLATLMIPGAVTMIPVFILIVRFGWYDSLLALIVPVCSPRTARSSCGNSSSPCRRTRGCGRLDGCNLLQSSGT